MAAMEQRLSSEFEALREAQVADRERVRQLSEYLAQTQVPPSSVATDPTRSNPGNFNHLSR